MDDLRSPALRLQVLLVCVLLGIYLLVYVPAPESADGSALAAVAASWVRSGSPNMDAVVYADFFMPSPEGYMHTLGADGALYAKKGVTPSLLLMPLVVLSDAVPWLPTRATLMLFNPLVLTATALMLFRFTVLMGYRPRSGLVVALSFGLATFALAYAKSLFGEPLAGLLVLIIVMALHAPRSARNLIVAGAALGLLAGINTVYVVFAPVAAALLLARTRRPRDVILLAIPVVIAGLLLGLYNLARFGDPLSSGYHFAAGEGFTVPFGVGMYGLFLSPYRGLFWYGPLVLLALPGWLLLRKTRRWLAWAILILVILQSAAFASWWSWHGGVVWAPRFLLPVLPLLALALAPLIDAMWTRRVLMPVFAALFALSTFVACLGAFYSYFPYVERYLNTRYVTSDSTNGTGYGDDVLTDPALSPIVGHLAMLSAGMPFEQDWLRSGDWTFLLIPGGLITVGVAQLFLTRSRRARLAMLTAAVVIALPLGVIRRSDRAVGDALTETLQPPGTVVAASAQFGTALLDLKQSVPALVLTAPILPDDPDVRAVWEYALRQRDRLWFLTWFAPADARNWQERELWETAAFVTERPLLDHRALLFDLAPDPPERAGGWRFGAISLDAYGAAVRPDGVQLILRWSAAAPLDSATWFVHLVDATGAIVAQQDRAPLGGYAPTETWTMGESVTDRLFLQSDSAPDTGTWRLRVGWIDVATSALLPVSDPIGAPQADSFALLPLE